ncbi:MAG TPA: tyrosine--tRNA ligase [Acidimicrobiia bacterium]|nr:tyrosine--tRNA ligase [Acidimicrobiia bacterium]
MPAPPPDPRSERSALPEPLVQGAVDLISPGELAAKLGRGVPLRVKLGIDPTASDIHLGFAVVLRKLRQFQDAGHVAVLILGDFTARIGDPSGRSATRPRLDPAEVDAHASSYIEQVTAILDPDPARLEIRRNSEWLGVMGIEDVLRLTSRTTIARMLERDDFAKRYASGTPISLMELLYPLLQGWDSVMVRADVELGGTDQLFNLLVGRQLQEQEGQPPQVVLTTPLLPGLSGGPKMSKSLGNYVGIAEPPAEQFGKLMSIPDGLLPDYLQYTTAWPQARIDEAVASLDAGPAARVAAKRLLARTVADLYHGPGAGERAEAEFDRVFKEHATPTEIPEFALAAALVDADGAIRPSRLLAAAGLVPSNREGVRKVGEGAVRLDGDVLASDDPMPAAELLGRTLQVGRRQWVRVVGEGS